MTAVSVVIPCFNYARYLPEALQSVLDQTRPPDEIIVVDDGSTDETAAVAARYPVRVISQTNQGIAAARNTGISASLGEALAFIDADDLWPRDSLEARLVRLETEPKVDCVFGRTEAFLSADLSDVDRARLHCPAGPMAARAAGTMLARRTVFDVVGLFEPTLRVGEFIDWVGRLTHVGAGCASIDTLCMRRRIHGANTVLQNKAGSSDYLRALKASLDRKSAAVGAGGR